MGVWTPERCDALRRLVAEGYSASAIALELGVSSRNAVIGKIHRLGLGWAKRGRPAIRRPPRPVTQPTLSQLQKRPSTPPPTGLPFLEIKGGQCRFPLNGHGSVVRLDTFRFCGNKVSRGSYCAYHARMVYKPIGEKRLYSNWRM